MDVVVLVEVTDVYPLKQFSPLRKKILASFKPSKDYTNCNFTKHNIKKMSTMPFK